jgi:type IV secretion system protein VirD4
MFEFILLERFLWVLLGGLGVYAGVITALGTKHKLATAKRGTKADIKDLLGEDGLHVSKNYQLSEKQCNGQTVVIAPTRIGKSTSIYIPNLLENKLRGSIIVPDPKEEIYELTSNYQKSIGRKVILYKPLDKKIQYNPLKECRNELEVKQLGQNLLINGALAFELDTGKKAQGIEWLLMAANLLNAALLHLYPKGTIREAVRLILTHDNMQLDNLFLKAKSSAREQYMSFKTSLDSPKTAASIKSTMVSYLQLFLDDLAIDKSDFNINDFRKRETMIYIQYPENKSIYLSPLTACIYSQLINHLIDDYKKESLPIWVMADEFCNLGQWSNFTVNMATAGSRHINFVLCLQSTSQLKQLYGENYLSILNNCNNKIILPGISDTETLRWVMQLCGETPLSIMQNEKEYKTKKLLFDMSEVRRIETGKLMILISNRQPVIDYQNTYYKQNKYKNNVY